MFEEDRAPGGGLWGRRVVAGLALLLATEGVWLHGCRDELTSDEGLNQDPDTYLTGAPAESVTTFYKVHFHWYGNDTDGWIVGYEYAISDSLPIDEDTLTYRFTTRTDSTFTFPVGASQQVLGHRFYVRAIDNEGATDPVPAWRFFGAIDLTPPKPEFTLAEAFDPNDPTGQRVMGLTSTNVTTPSDTVPAGWNVRFRWRGSDADRMIDEYGDTLSVGEITHYEYWLNPYEVSPHLVGAGDTAVSYSGLTSGAYRFSLRGVDDAKFRGLDAKVRTFVWNMDPETHYVASDSIDPVTGDSLLSVLATSAAWYGEREFIEGDTIPLVASSGTNKSVQRVTVRLRVWGYDPDDDMGTKVGHFTYSTPRDPRWIALTADPTVAPNTLVLADLATDTLRVLQVRCTDGHGRPDGTPASFRILINRSPVLMREFDDGTGHLIQQYPQPGQIIDIDDLPMTLELPDSQLVRRLPVRVRAIDPDASTDEFSYRFVVPPHWTMETDGTCSETKDYCTFAVTFPRSLAEGLGSTPRAVSVTVRIEEHARGDEAQLLVKRSIPFFIVDN